MSADSRRTGFGAKMMSMKLHNIAPITELKRDAASLIERASEQRSPIVITQNGRATACCRMSNHSNRIAVRSPC